MKVIFISANGQLEVHSRADNLALFNFNWGPAVEGRVAAALYDLYDSNNESYDWVSAGFPPIAHIALGTSQLSTFQDFWNAWNAAYPQISFPSKVTLWWNTINYGNIQQLFLPVIKN